MDKLQPTQIMEITIKEDRLFSSSPPFQTQFWKVYLTLSRGNEIWRGEQIDKSEQICSSYFTA